MSSASRDMLRPCERTRTLQVDYDAIAGSGSSVSRRHSVCVKFIPLSSVWIGKIKFSARLR